MFAQGYRQFAAAIAGALTMPGEEGLRAMAHRAMAFMVDAPARYSLLFHRTIPGFTPSPESYAPSAEQLEHTRAWFAANGMDSGALDLFTALITGLRRPADRQRPRRRPLDPSGGHRRRHVPHPHQSRQQDARRPAEGARS